MQSILKIGLCYDASVITGAPAEGLPTGLDIVLFPELLEGGYSSLYRTHRPHEPTDDFSRVLRQASRTYSTTIIAGSTFMASEGGIGRNSTLVFSRGRLIHRYDKIHLFRPALDHRYFHPGTTYGTFLLPDVQSKAGIVICFDIRFPELIRLLTLKGMKLLFVPSRWPSSRDDAWQTLLKARAIENQIFTVGCNAKGREGGYSYVFDPTGRLVFSNKGKLRNRIDVVKIDLKTLRQSRKLHDNIREAVFLRRHLSS